MKNPIQITLIFSRNSDIGDKEITFTLYLILGEEPKYFIFLEDFSQKLKEENIIQNDKEELEICKS